MGTMLLGSQKKYRPHSKNGEMYTFRQVALHKISLQRQLQKKLKSISSSPQRYLYSYYIYHTSADLDTLGQGANFL